MHPRSRTLVLWSALTLLLAGIIAAGCGGDDDGQGAEGITGDSGALAWMPQDTWLIASANVNPATLDEALDTLGRLPIWSLAESFLPASDGAGLRKELLTQIGKSAPDSAGVSAAKLEAAFGERAGIAITDNDYRALTRITDDGGAANDSPLVIWIDVDDEDQADAMLGKLRKGKATTGKHKGHSYQVKKEAGTDFVWTVDDGIALITPGVKQMKHLIDTRESDDSLAADTEAKAAISGGIGDALVGFALATDPVLAIIPDAAEDRASVKGADLTALRKLVKAKAIDGLIPDWIGGSMTIDDVGLRIKTTWSNPRDLAKPNITSRQLSERMPKDSMMAYGAVTSGDELGRLQAAWKEAKASYGFGLRDLSKRCDAMYMWACDIGVELLAMALEDSSLASAMADAGPASSAGVQNFDASYFASLAAIFDPPPKAIGNIDPQQSQRSLEVVSSGSKLAYAMPAALKQALKAGGITVVVTDEQRAISIKITPGSPAGRELTKALKDPMSGAALTAGFGALGLDPRTLLTPAGLALTGEQVDGLVVMGFPQDVPSGAAKSLAGKADTLADDEGYASTVKLAKPPKQVGYYGYINLTAYVDAILAAAGQSSPQAKQLAATVHNNLTDIPGVLFWTSRATSGNETLGVFEMVVPIEP